MRLKIILHIDDDPDDISIFQEAISKISFPYLLESYTDSKAAISFLEETILKPNIIFLDINMPVLNGQQTLQLIRNIEGLHDVPVIMYSTSIREKDKNVFNTLGAKDFLQKANHFDQTLKEVESMLSKYLGL